MPRYDNMQFFLARVDGEERTINNGTRANDLYPTERHTLMLDIRSILPEYEVTSSGKYPATTNLKNAALADMTA
jgi:hypothetical protein